MLYSVSKQPNIDVVRDIARYIVSTEFHNLPRETVDITKRSILDTLGVALGASGLVPEVKALVEIVKDGGGKAESTIWGSGCTKVPAWMAAFANGAMAHALDYDDVYDVNGVHPSATCVPAALALSERMMTSTGADLIVAIAIGNDIISRISQAVSANHGWFLTPTLGVFSGTAACAKILRLTEDQIIDAFGIAFCQAAGTMQIVHGTDSNIRAMYESFVGKTSVLAAVMAQHKISGVKSSMEGDKGLFNIYFNGEYDRSTLTDHLGERFEGATVSFKAWPFCRRAHPAITAMINLLRRENVSVENIQSITVDTNAGSEVLCIPTASRVTPRTPLDAKFSIPYTIATATLKGWIGLEDFFPEAIKDPQTIEIAKRVVSRRNPAYENIRGMTPGRVEITIKDGRRYAHEERFPYGHPDNPISQGDSVRKFRECAAKAAIPKQSEDIERIVQLIEDLEKVDNLKCVMDLLG